MKVEERNKGNEVGVTGDTTGTLLVPCIKDGSHGRGVDGRTDRGSEKRFIKVI